MPVFLILTLISAVTIGSGAFADMGVVEKKSANSTEKRFILGSIFNIRESRSRVEEVILAKNVQTLALLQAPKNIDPQVSNTNPMVIVDDSAISNENAGMDGSIATGSDFRPTSDQISLYTVRPGDTINGIAEMYDVTVNTIRWANDMTAYEPVRQNQILVILPVAGVKYMAKKNDTISKIAKQYGADASETAEFNGVDSEKTLAVGTTIIIPDGDGSFGLSHVAATKKPTKITVKTTKTPATSVSVSASSGFSRPVSGGTRTQGIHGNNGIDIAAPLNTPIMAAGGGTVVLSRSGGWNGGYGNYVVIKHANGIQTLYAHMNSNTVSQGETVSKGQVIGKMGNTGQSTGVHLHFEVRGGKNPF